MAQIFLSKLDFAFIKLADYHFIEQCQMFNNADFIIGLNGAGFANICFCKPGTKVIEITSNTEGKILENLGKKNELTIHPPIGYINLPLREISSLITLIEKAYMKNMSSKEFLRDSLRKKQQKLVTEKTVLQMREISNKFNANFILVILDWSNRLTKDQYEIFLKKSHLPVLVKN